MRRVYRAMTACERCENVEPPPILPRGPWNSTELVLLGRNPGRVENEYGKPFIGRGGKLLDSELERISIVREKCWVTNLCLCYTTGDRPPTKEEMQNCLRFLKAQLLVLQPKLVVAMSKHVTEFLFDRRIVWAEERGKVTTLEIAQGVETAVMPATHPGEALRGARGNLYADFNDLNEMVDKMKLKVRP